MDERLVEAIVEQVVKRLAQGTAGSAPSDDLVTDDIRAGRVKLGVSVRHAHLTQEHVEALFGAGAKLTSMRALYQPGEYACDQTFTVVGPTGKTLGPVRVLGPTRKASQLELSLTDCYQLGLKSIPPVRASGDHRESVGVTLVGPAGAVTLQSGVIRANRHVHLHTSQAAALGLKDNDVVDVRIEGQRPMILLGCQLRANDGFRAEMHIDTDDANAAGVKSGDTAQILPRR